MTLYDGIHDFQLQCLMMILQLLRYGKKNLNDQDGVEDDEVDDEVNQEHEISNNEAEIQHFLKKTTTELKMDRILN